MADKTPIIALRLEGALQSWGDHSKWDERDSGNFPTKSGVVGLIACAMGLSRENEKVVDLTRSFQMAVRADRPGTRIIDFNTVMGNPLYTAGGKRPQSASTIVSHRCFLEDASFLALIEPSPEWIRPIIDSLKSPKWPIYLGRKSCVPSRPRRRISCFQRVRSRSVSGIESTSIAAMILFYTLNISPRTSPPRRRSRLASVCRFSEV